jgi:cytochrome c-type biogenesis protein CcmH/NrfG
VSARLGAIVMAGVLALYLALVGWWAVSLLRGGQPVAVAMGVALVVLGALGGWALARELWFGVRAEQIGRRLEREGGLPSDEVAVHPSGRAVRADADAIFPAYRTEVEQHPDDWRSWYRLGLAYDGAGDRRRARAAVRQAIRLERAES